MSRPHQNYHDARVWLLKRSLQPTGVAEVEMEPLGNQTQAEPVAFDFSAFPADTLFLDRRTLPPNPTPKPRPSTGATRPRKERRRRVDPTTFEKQYTGDEIEFMNAVQSFKVRSGKMFPSHGDILRVALALGYRQAIDIEEEADGVVEASVAVGSHAPG